MQPKIPACDAEDCRAQYEECHRVNVLHARMTVFAIVGWIVVILLVFNHAHGWSADSRVVQCQKFLNECNNIVIQEHKNHGNIAKRQIEKHGELYHAGLGVPLLRAPLDE